MKTKDLILNPANPRLIKDARFEKLVQSIREFPKMMELRPIIIDKDKMILGGNMRYKALLELGYKEIPDEWVKLATDLTDEEKKEFIIKDNVAFGANDWDLLANEWDQSVLEDWGMEFGFDMDSDSLTTNFDIPSDDKEPFQQMTFHLADQQAEFIQSALDLIKDTDEFKKMETQGNENANGNALYLIVSKWVKQKK